MKLIVYLLKKSEALSALSIRLVYLTRKAKYPIHPKHLLKKNKHWFKSYLTKGDIVLDLGCGVGTDAIGAARIAKKVIGIDINKRSLEIAQETIKNKKVKNVTFFRHDLNKKLPFKKREFSKIICSDVLEHLNKRNFAIDEIKRVLAKNGLLLLVVDNPNTKWKKMLKKHGQFYYADTDHKYEYPKEEILRILERKGFKINSIIPVTYDTPLKGFIDITGGISLSLYKKLGVWKQEMLKRHPGDTTGFKIVAKLI